MIGVLFAAAVLLAETTPAAAGNPADATPPAAAKAPPKVNKDGLICRTEEVLGSRIPKRVCFTPEEAAQRAQEDRTNVEHMQGQQNYNPR